MDPHVTRLETFIAKERWWYPGENNNRFAFALGQACRYERFARIVLYRHREISAEWQRRHEEHMNQMRGQSGTRMLTADETAEGEYRARLSTVVHLEVESFYLFAKIFLDHAARFIEHYFGKARGLSLDSHDDLTKNFERYAVAKSLAAPPEFIGELRELKKRISDFRDYQIAHAKNPRTAHAMVWGSNREVRMAMTRIYPRPDEIESEQQESESLEDLMRRLEAYTDRLAALVVENRPRSRYMRERKPENEEGLERAK